VDVGGGDHAARLHGLEQETAAVAGLLNAFLAEAGLAVFPAKMEFCGFSHGRRFLKHFCSYFIHCFLFFNLLFVADLNPRIHNTKTVESARMVAMFFYIKFKFKYTIHL
jgi:hypothetical protein